MCAVLPFLEKKKERLKVSTMATKVCYSLTFLLFWNSWKGFLRWWWLLWSSSLCFLTFLTYNNATKNVQPSLTLGTYCTNTHPPSPCPTPHPKDPSPFSGSLLPPQQNQWCSHHHPRTSLHRESKKRGKKGRRKWERGKELTASWWYPAW